MPKTNSRKRRTAAAGKNGKKAPKRVWHITRFEQRFELPDDVKICRQSALIYTRDFVSGGDDESMGYHRQIRTLESYDNYLELLGAFGAMKRMAADMGRVYRGYLLDGFFEPADDVMIAGWLRVDALKAKRILKSLAEVRLIEKIDLPTFDPTAGRSPGRAKDKKTKKRPKTPNAKGATKARKQGAKGRSTARAKNAIPVRSGTERNTPEHSGTLRSIPEHSERLYARKGKLKLKEKLKLNGKRKVKKKEKKKRQTKKKQAPDAPEEKAKANLKIHNLEGGVIEIECQGEIDSTKTSRTPTATPPRASPLPKKPMPKMPTETDARECRAASRSSRNTGTSASDSFAKNPGDVNDPSRYDHDEKIYGARARAFAAEIYIALGIPYAHDSPEAARELCSIAGGWEDAEANGLPPGALDELWRRSVKEAGRLAKRPRSKFKKTRAAVWRWIFNRRLDARAKTGAIAG